jgi:hypothetical protein
VKVKNFFVQKVHVYANCLVWQNFSFTLQLLLAIADRVARQSKNVVGVTCSFT